MDRYPGVPINIEIKGGVPEEDSDYLHCAEVLAKFLNGYGRTKGIMVVSFNDAATERFHQLAPDFDLAPGTALVAGYILAGQPLPEGYAAFQVPKDFSGHTIVTQDFVDRAHGDGYGVHVWTIDDAPTMNELFDLGVDGIMSAQPMRLEHVMCNRDEPRPPLPAVTGGEHCNPDASIICSAKARNLQLDGRTASFDVVRRDDLDSKCAGTVTLSVKGKLKKRVSHRFNFGWHSPSEGGPSQFSIKLNLPVKLANQLRHSGAAAVKLLPYAGFARKRSVALG